MKSTKETAVMERPVVDEVAPPAVDTKASDDRAELLACVQRIEQWARFNDAHVRKIAIDALRKVGEWEL